MKNIQVKEMIVFTQDKVNATSADKLRNISAEFDEDGLWLFGKVDEEYLLLGLYHTEREADEAVEAMHRAKASGELVYQFP